MMNIIVNVLGWTLVVLNSLMIMCELVNYKESKDKKHLNSALDEVAWVLVNLCIIFH